MNEEADLPLAANFDLHDRFIVGCDAGWRCLQFAKGVEGRVATAISVS